MVLRGFFKDRKSDYGIAKEEQEVCLDREMCGGISKAQGVVDEQHSILKVPDMDDDFLVCTDTSKEGLGGVLMQYGRVITYISIKLRRHEENYATHDLELLAIVYTLRVWRHYLIGWKFELKTDHCGLQHIFTQRDLNARQ
jgi:hypothetical protein